MANGPGGGFMDAEEEIRELCAHVSLAEDDAELDAALEDLQHALRLRALQMENLHAKVLLEIAKKRKPAGR
jgi:hypothetical protein